MSKRSPSDLPIWNYFEKSIDGSKTAMCNNCRRMFSFKTTVTNLKQHLRQKHISVYNDFINFGITRESTSLPETNRQSPTFVAVEQDREDQNSKSLLRELKTKKPTVRDRINIIKPREHRTEERLGGDEYSTFGELVAMKLKKIRCSSARSTAQYHINKILYKAEMGAYDKSRRQNNFTAGSSSANLVDEDDHSSRSSSPTKSTEYYMKVDELEDENIS